MSAPTLPGVGVRSATAVLRAAHDVVDPGLRLAVDRLPTSIRHLAGYHFGWWDQHGTPTSAFSGKGVRPALVLLACQAMGGCGEEALPAALAVELVHNASLLHDDIIDNDRTRRKRPATWAAFGVPAGILAGDALFFLACQLLAEADDPLARLGPTRLYAAVQGLIDGEYQDTLFEGRADVGLAECLAMASAKTSALTGASCALGAIAAGANESQIAHLADFGTHLGCAFQLMDDVLGIWGDAARTGKPAMSDLRSRKKSLPVAAALASRTPAGRALARLYHQSGPPSEADLHTIAGLIEEAGGRNWAITEARRHVTAALDHLQAAGANPIPAAELAAIATLFIERDH
ncbi:polyprenyl synthetase family protein [Streptomyces sp. 4.24]|uniref:polyprenyl synthetase family protein n=1 Tax=Streptomyces tritrimontium TaxID=3406573 RepID=UPI003BB49FC5